MIRGIEGVTRRKQPKQPMPKSVAAAIVYISDHHYQKNNNLYLCHAVKMKRHYRDDY
jgi:uncharacterized protein YgiM (DUF1202 family)